MVTEHSNRTFIAVNPVIDSRNVAKTITFFTERLGFALLFVDDNAEPRYAGIGRDGIEVHVQWHSDQEWATMSGSAYRFVVADPDAYYQELLDRGTTGMNHRPEPTGWNTYEFGLYDPDNNALFFYRDLIPADQAGRIDPT